MSKKSKQLDRFEKYSIILKYYCFEYPDIKEAFDSKTCDVLFNNKISSFKDIVELNKKQARNLFGSSKEFKSFVDQLFAFSNKKVSAFLMLYGNKKKYLLIEPFRILDEIYDHIKNDCINFNFTDCKSLENKFNSLGIKTYYILKKLGILGISNIEGLGEKAYLGLVEIIKGEQIKLQTGELQYTKKRIAELRKHEQKGLKKAKKESKKEKEKNGGCEVKKPAKAFSLYGLASGKPGTKYTIKEFLQIVKNSKKRPGKEPLIIDEDTFDSKQEVKIFKKLNSKDSFKRIATQCMGMEYKYKGEKHTYFPDFVILTNTNKIVIMEVKEVCQMFSKQNLAKYKELKKNCKANGYLYIMCDKQFHTYENLHKLSYSKKVKKAIDEAIDNHHHFNYADYKELIKGMSHKEIQKVRNHIGIYLASNKNLKMVGDLTYEINNLYIVRK